MKKLSELYNGYPDILINDIKTNSKEVNPGDLFVCIKGVNADRNNFIEEAVRNGASAIITIKDIELDIPVINVDPPNEELFKISQMFYDFDYDKYKIIGVTGTNGKTTVSSIIQDLIGETCGYIGTNGLKSKTINDLFSGVPYIYDVYGTEVQDLLNRYNSKY